MAVSTCTSFTLQLLRGRFFMAFATIIILSFIGTSYIFGLYSNSIKTTLGYDQTTLNLISFFKDLGAYISVHAGLIMEVAPPWVVLSLGAVLNFVGYFMIWLSVTHRIAHPPVWQMCLFICIGANSLGFANTGALVTCVKNFPGNRGVVIGLLKGYIGLGGAVMTQLYHALYGNDTNAVGVILLISWLPAVASLLFAYSVRDLVVVNRQAKREKRFFTDMLYMSLALAGFILVMLIVEMKVWFGKGGYGGSVACIFVLLVLPLYLVFREEYSSWNARGDIAVTTSTVSKIGAPDEPVTPHVPWFKDVFSPPPSGEDHTILQATFSIDMQILFIASICGLGGHLTTIDNLGQIGTSLGYSKKSISTFVSLIAIWQYLGRVMGGLVSEYLLTKFKWPRPVSLTIILFLSCIGHLLVAFNAPYGLYISSIIIGFCFGAEWTYLYAIISELFGLKYYATLYNYGSLAAPLGSYLFNVLVAGHLYDKEGEKQLEALGVTRGEGQSLNCTGVKCYQLAYIIITAATFFSAIVSLILVVRTRSFYKGDIYKKFQEDEKSLSTEVALTENVKGSFRNID
ncbi:hypothetical protein RND81_06G211600 [Saponaria officinalis]|uniref:Nodulin-like domain-containing protein n=1 Tax=Saponaria officinalis TaxID=3572 RepID=A0AAW1KCA3_SAPOF